MDKLTLVADREDILVELEVHGDLSVKGHDEMEVSVKTGSPEDTVLEQTDAGINLVCQDDCKVLVPRNARLVIKKANGDAGIKAVEGAVEVGVVDGTLRLRSVGEVNIQSVRGNLEAKNIMGGMQIGEVSGNALIRDVQGDFTVESVSGNLVLDDADGNVNASAEGNATLRLDPAPGADYEVKAQGNITCSLPADASVDIEVVKAGRVLVNFSGVQDGRNEAPYNLILADGDANLRLEADGQVMLNSQAPDLNFIPEIEIGDDINSVGEAFADQVARQIEVQMQNFGQQLSSQLANMRITLGAAGFNQEQIERFQEQANVASQRASEQAQEKLNRAQERLERKLEQAERRAERQARFAESRAQAAAEKARHREHRGMRGHPFGSAEPEISHDPVSDEERLLILKMLQEKKISMVEAESLLASLEGKEKN